MVDLRFTDIPGLWQHFWVPPRTFDHDAIVDGVGFDGAGRPMVLSFFERGVRYKVPASLRMLMWLRNQMGRFDWC